MIVHVVCFKYRSDIDAPSRAQHRERLRALHDLDGIIDLKVGQDVVRSARSFDTGLVIMFRDRAALDAYQKHPRHIPVAQFGPASCDSVVSVDFEA
jgi:hypothetical protein